MSIAAIASLGANPDMASLSSITSLAAPEVVNAAPGTEGVFQPLLSALTQLNTDITAGEKGLQSVALGDLDNLHQSVMNMEKVRLSMQLLLQVRSRALDAYQELMRMQV
jgi:flagellar hook-basal body complex protein FliE